MKLSKEIVVALDFRNLLIIILAAILLTSSYSSWADEWDNDIPSNQWQRDRLLQPSRDDLEQDKNGQVFIYDGITDSDIASAMDQFFDRISSMMFVNTVRSDENGQPVIDPQTGEIESDDDC